MARFFSPDAEQVEYPSAVRPTGSRRPLADMLAASERGAGLLSTQSYESSPTSSRGRPPRSSSPGAPPSRGRWEHPGRWRALAHVGAFYEFADDGRIARQSSYDCYEPFPT